jgi:hypothetical protein
MVSLQTYCSIAAHACDTSLFVAVEAVLETDSESFTLPRVREDAMVMIRRLIRLMETLKPLPYKKVLTFKLFYYDDATPSDYNPPHFVDSTHDVHPFFAAPPFKVAVGAVGSVSNSIASAYTQYHCCYSLIHCRNSIPSPLRSPLRRAKPARRS